MRPENLKYIERGGGRRNELFDLEKDPSETVNRAGKPEYRQRRPARQIMPNNVGYYRWKEE